MAKHPEHEQQRHHPHHENHQHHHSAAERHEFEDVRPVDEFPPIYSKDLFDPRRSHWPYASSVNAPPSRFGRIMSWTLGILIVAIIVAGLVSAVASGIGK